MVDVARVREKGAVEQALSGISGELLAQPEPSYRDRLRGSKAALFWAIGRSATAPASGRLIERPGAGDLYHEAMWADEIVTGVRPLPRSTSREFVGGVAGALMWMLRRTSESPGPASTTPGLRDAGEVVRSLELNRELLATPPPGWDDEELEEQRGVIAALDWVAGAAARSPVSNRRLRADAGEVERELGKAQVMTRIGATQREPSRDFAGGVYDALLWALERSERQPGPY